MTFRNEGQSDRGARMLAGILLLAAAWALSLNTLGMVLFAIGVIALATGIVGWCPAYSVFSVSTMKAPAAHCPDCATEPRRG